MNKDVTNLIKDSTSTFLNIAQMTQYRMKYVQDKNKEAKEGMYKHTFLAGVGIFSLLTIGIAGLIESRKDDNRLLEYNHWCQSLFSALIDWDGGIQETM